MIPKYMQQAQANMGVTETPGRASNKKVEAYFADAGFPGLKDDIPWCAGFVASMLKRGGLPNEVEPKMRLWAASYARCGTALKAPVWGAIGVKTRIGGGHVGFVVAANKDFVWMLGGNQGDKVSVARFPRAAFSAFRLPTGVDIKTLPRLPSTGTGAANPTES